MSRRLRHCVAAILAASVLNGAAGTASAGTPTVEDFFRRPQYLGAQLSPNGHYLAVIAPVGEQRGVAVIDLDRKAVVRMKSPGDGDVLRVQWQNDKRLIVFVGDLQQVAGEPPRESGIVAVNRDGSDSRVLTAMSGERGFFRAWSVQVQRVLVGTDDVLLTARDRNVNSEDLYRYDTTTGAKTLLSFDSPGNVSRWVVDFEGVPRAAVSDDVDHDASAWYVRKGAKDPWVKVEEAKLGRLDSQPMQFSPDGKTLYVSGRRGGADRAAIYGYQVDTGTWGRAIVDHPERDVDASNASFIADYKAHQLLGLRYTNDRPSAVWFDAQWARVQKSVDRALPDTVNVIQRSENGDRWIVVTYSDRDPGDAYLLDGKTMEMEKLFSYEPWVDPKAMAPTKWVRYKARDGLTIPALLTVPHDAHDKPVPLIVDIHGGPIVPADDWGYRADVQFFASRGYAVLQPQFRGTEGFGFKLQSSGYREWGDAMQDDLEDGVAWAVAQGIVDPSRVCFFGGSYGGYAAMWGAVKDAGLIKCAVSLAGVTSIDYLFDNAQTDLSRLAENSTLLAYQIGDPKTDRARFKRVNPLDHADKVGVPILLAYGASDRRVPLVHGTEFRAALDRYHKPYEWVVYADEGHGLSRDADLFDFFGRVERFLAKYLGGASTATPAH
ncbi:MAG TPA: prolyl oligopeptidase family serine peptidase [Casimicrobiaceae bacterium]|nr:prolyl oligopeptidase family serine peptidase [Casimicrobiaceae bacterium]